MRRQAGFSRKADGPHKTLRNCFVCRSRLGLFDRIFAALAGQGRCILAPIKRTLSLESKHHERDEI